MTAAAVETTQSQARVDLEFRVSQPNDDGSDTPDTAVINSAFLRGLRTSEFTNGLPSETFFSVGRQAWNGIRRDFLTTIAHPPGKTDHVCGFVTHAKYVEKVRATRDDQRKARQTGKPEPKDREVETVTVAWIHVTKEWRKFGVARALLRHIGVAPGQRFVVLFASPESLALARAKGFRPAFLPFIVWRWLVPDGTPVRGLNKEPTT